MNDFATPPVEAVADPVAAYEAAMKGAQSAETPQMRAKFVDQMEILARQLPAAGTAPAIDPTTGQAPAADASTAYPAADSAFEYVLQTPPGVEIEDHAQAGAIKTAMFEAGIPAGFANEAFRSIAELHVAGAFTNDRAYEDAVAQCRTAIVTKHGDAAPALIRDAVGYLNGLAKSHPALEEAVAAAMASPHAVMQAANLARHGTTKRK